MSPLLGIIIGLIVTAVLVYLVYPQKGFLDKWSKGKRDKKKVLIEDALKHIYDCEYKGIKCTIHSVGGNLSISNDAAADLLSNLEKMGLIISKPEFVKLTSDGKSHALKVIRVHRLWEKYLADHTSIGEEKWHHYAEDKEHDLSPKEADELAARLGNPFYDPHGDPIPTADGEILDDTGVALTSLASGEFAVITHIEDEPHAIYSQIVALNLHRGQQIQLVESDQRRVKIIAEGEECILAPIIANNITVTKIEEEEEIQSDFKSLSTLKQGEEGVIAGISQAVRGRQRRRLMDLGIVPGSKVTAELFSIGSDPVAYLVRGATVALRRNQTDQIFIKSN